MIQPSLRVKLIDNIFFQLLIPPLSRRGGSVAKSQVLLTDQKEIRTMVTITVLTVGRGTNAVPSFPRIQSVGPTWPRTILVDTIVVPAVSRRICAIAFCENTFTLLPLLRARPPSRTLAARGSFDIYSISRSVAGPGIGVFKVINWSWRGRCGCCGGRYHPI